jgi:pimeloyl-[acyl-carrier protein] methyl ester esterase
MIKVIICGGLVLAPSLFNQLIGANQAQYQLLDINRIPAVHGLDAICNNLTQQITCTNHQVILVGYSSGGLCAIKLALRYPKLVKHVILLNSSPCFQAQEDWPGISSASFARLSAKLQHLSLKQFQEHFCALAAYPKVSAAAKLYPYISPSCTKENLLGWFDILATTDLRQDLAQLPSRITTIYSAYDNLAPIASLGLNPRHQQLILSNATHGNFITAELKRQWQDLFYE